MGSSAVITGSGLYTPDNAISNEELVSAFNAWVDLYNAEHAGAIARGERDQKMHSSVEFIEKASGIKSRFVIDKSGILDPTRMAPNIPERDNESPSVMCEIACAAAREALDQAHITADQIDMVIVAASNMQRAYPAMAIEVQAALGATGFAFDMNVACSSATFGIQQARDAVRSGSAKKSFNGKPRDLYGASQLQRQGLALYFWRRSDSGNRGEFERRRGKHRLGHRRFAATDALLQQHSQ